jgi:hypothetical protein
MLYYSVSIILVWEKYADAGNTVETEAGAAAALYHVSGGLNGDHAGAVQAALIAYLRSVVSDDWPAMEKGKESKNTHRALEGLYQALSKSIAADNVGSVAPEVFRQLDTITQARGARIGAAEGALAQCLQSASPFSLERSTCGHRC